MRGFVTSPDGEPLDWSSLDPQRLRVFCRTRGMECIQDTLTDHRSSCRLPLAIAQVRSRDLSDAEQHSDQPWEKMETAGGSCARSADPRLVPGNCVCLHRLVCPSVSVLSLLYSPAYSPAAKSSRTAGTLQYRLRFIQLYSTALPGPSHRISNPDPLSSGDQSGLPDDVWNI